MRKVVYIVFLSIFPLISSLVYFGFRRACSIFILLVLFLFIYIYIYLYIPLFFPYELWAGVRNANRIYSTANLNLWHSWLSRLLDMTCTTCPLSWPHEKDFPALIFVKKKKTIKGKKETMSLWEISTVYLRSEYCFLLHAVFIYFLGIEARSDFRLHFFFEGWYSS